MPIYQWLYKIVETCSSQGTVRGFPNNWLKKFIAFAGGFTLGHLYYFYLLKNIPLPDDISFIILLTISLVLGIGNVVCMQLRCITLLSMLLYCGKPGRAVLKVVVLTYVIAGPITNMGLNAKEVVRVFACSTRLANNLSIAKHEFKDDSFKQAIFSMSSEVNQVKDTMNSITDVITPIKIEIEDYKLCFNNNLKTTTKISNCSTAKLKKKEYYQNYYLNKLEKLCKNQLSRAEAFCTSLFTSAYGKCLDAFPKYSSLVLCEPLKLINICNLEQDLRGLNICDSKKQVNPGLEEGYVTLKKAEFILANNRDVALQYKISPIRELYDFQDATETGDNVMHAFEEKYIIMHCVRTVVDLFVALLFLRIFFAAIAYHDEYLTDIEYDNIYITGGFKKIDRKRRARDQYSLLPLKKMERSKYVDVYSLTYMWNDRNKLLTHILKLLLEVVTATTFVMLDRLFYEALDMVRQHSEMELLRQSTRDLVIEVEGTGAIANVVRKVIASLSTPVRARETVTNKLCLPRPRLMPSSYYIKIYGGYLWILLLLYINPYTVRLKRWVCSYFYPCREKQRILHLYNDILKKRMKLQKTLRRKAVQSVRAYYLSGENLLSLRVKFPRLLGWLRVLPAARMTCLICGETEPRDYVQTQTVEENWHSCTMSKCPFVYCVECWREVGANCLACDPSLADLSDIDSFSEDEFKSS